MFTLFIIFLSFRLYLKTNVIFRLDILKLQMLSFKERVNQSVLIRSDDGSSVFKGI